MSFSKYSVSHTPSYGPVMYSKKPAPWRSHAAFGLLMLGFVIIIGKAAYVQVLNKDFYIQHGENRFARTLKLPADRGKILDRNQRILASSVPLPSYWANPKSITISDEQRKTLARLFELNPAKLKQKLEASDRHFVWLKRNVGSEKAGQIEALKIKGLHQVKEYQRVYPEGSAMAHVLGLTNTDNQGVAGVEGVYNALLKGEDGAQRVYRNSSGAVVEKVGETIPPQVGKDLELSIDSRIQFFAFQKLRKAVQEHHAKAGSLVVLDVQTGEILAMANYPSFNPKKRKRLRMETLRNRILTDSFEPGSTMKPFVAALALEQNKVGPETVLSTASGRLKVGRSTISDLHTNTDLTVAQVIQRSSNVGIAKIALDFLSPQDMWAFYQNLGFGQKSDLDFGRVATGRLRNYQNWRPIEQATMSYGYGLSTTLLQLAQAYTVFARDGVRIPITLLKRDPQAPAVAGQRLLSPRVAQQVRIMLGMAVGSEGTARKAQAIGYSVGGKTGTTYKFDGKQYAEDKYRSLFVGLAPLNVPRIVVAVMLDEPSNGLHYGGDVAAPVFSATVQQTLRVLGVSSDMPVPRQLLAQSNQTEADVR